jgi:putative heme-binding domain-containing protein
VTTKDDREFSGIISSETPASITLTLPGGQQEVLARSSLTTMTGSKLSLMPDGFEKTFDQQAMSDLIAYLRNQ